MHFIFVNPPTFEEWDYDNPLTVGIGGSETAVVELAKRLAKRRHKVTVYGPIKRNTKTDWEGTEWYPLEKIDYSQKGIWILCRGAFVHIDRLTKDGNKILLQMQDVFYNKMNQTQANKFDYLLPLCTSHYNFTKKKYPEAKVLQSANGIRTDLIEEIEKENIQRNPYKLMFASSPDRGLFALLNIFKIAKQRIPQLELHIFYGFNNIDKFTKTDDIPLGDEHVTKREILEATKQPGVFLRGRTGQMDLYREWFSSGIWCHPSAVFAETSCITSMDAQACGAIPITAPVWALADNVKYGYMIQGQPINNALARMEYVEKIEDIFKRKNIEKMRKEMMTYARDRFNWEGIVDQYEKIAKA